ncbi:TetR/AcrR family transcriptional regulator [Streptomyces flavofungini]|uniref:TetR/AcrR family transcriptional regulator n=1 Tax=Streptomyces flavofungini TaxID=68200 RepID=A0ABS0X818_9ACTN|nr:TetR/AcrR family transcriptional regulator [Streptomyces flavofungini]MBJ3809347.1 TetR/AcrR family transcriptional regulator [Streptomyces flavofungini]GHC77723.1 TetR family transcriptional regulator [Streptomyces flavofungini]
MAADRHSLRARKQPRQARAELTRQRILTAAAHVFAEHGYAAGTTNRIAERARISIGSLYQYYPNKDTILLELVTRHLDAGVLSLKEHRDGDRPDSLEAIMRGYVRSVIDNHLDDPKLLQVMMEQTPHAPELVERMARHEREQVAHTRELLASHPEVRVTDIDVAAHLVVSAVGGIVHQLVAAPRSVDVRRLEDELVAMVTRYLTLG